MKHALIFLVGLLIGLGLYWGIGSLISEDGPEDIATELTETTEATEPATEPNLIDEGQPWDEDGVLTELTLQIPGAWRYSYCIPFGEKLLFYGYDSHLSTDYTMEFLLINPVTGQITATASYTVRQYITPQIFQEYIYLCDSQGGKVFKLDGSLSVVEQWSAPTQGWYWFVGAEETLYLFGDEKLERYDLVDGSMETMFARCTMDAVAITTNYVSITLKATVDTEYAQVILDLSNGEILFPPVDLPLYTTGLANDLWLCRLESSESIYYLHDGMAQYRIQTQDDVLQLLQDGNLLLTTIVPQKLNLYATDGQFRSSCRISEQGNYYLLTDPIWNEEAGGYFILVKSYEGTLHVLFWDLNKPVEGENLALEPILEPSEAMKALRSRADQLEKEFGVEIFMGEECRTEFEDFQGSISTNYEEIELELDSLETALRQYPDGFLRQLRADFEKGIEIHFLEELVVEEGDRAGGSFAAFAYHSWDRAYVVLDILQANEYTYFHEFSHIIDKYLERNAETRTDALYSEAAWASLNPDYFTYADSYEGYEDRGFDAHWFIDAYATTNPTEDRARVMEFAMTPYMEHRFEEGSGLYRKLEFYSRCIRDAFDTTGWPEVTLWEQYLN